MIHSKTKEIKYKSIDYRKMFQDNSIIYRLADDK